MEHGTLLRVGSSPKVFPSLARLERQVAHPLIVQPAPEQGSSSQAGLTLPWSLRSLETILALPSSGAEAERRLGAAPRQGWGSSCS